jgi:hypothetical protein
MNPLELGYPATGYGFSHTDCQNKWPVLATFAIRPQFDGFIVLNLLVFTSGLIPRRVIPLEFRHQPSAHIWGVDPEILQRYDATR